ncbi:hypothetical protein Naga_101318g1 [Nannochloropsis gaditana]|uniref:Uncharacterized protein n=1 Tax=Nannochloropsis gaditana TaxID=72520 RepID=W7T3G2_9STRA|nr:hypothetical protein Naga_101318g1 [Nannochloropsis gaditana]
MLQVCAHTKAPARTGIQRFFVVALFLCGHKPSRPLFLQHYDHLLRFKATTFPTALLFTPDVSMSTRTGDGMVNAAGSVLTAVVGLARSPQPRGGDGDKGAWPMTSPAANTDNVPSPCAVTGKKESSLGMAATAEGKGIGAVVEAAEVRGGEGGREGGRSPACINLRSDAMGLNDEVSRTFNGSGRESGQE